MTTPPQTEIALRVVVLHPPPGVATRMQHGRDGLLDPASSSAARLAFDLSLRVGGTRADGGPVLLGSFAHGRPDDRFLYVNSGTAAGQTGSPWSRRAKLKLAAITAEMLRAARAQPGAVIEAVYEGTGRDGGPTCATVKEVEWRIVPPGEGAA
jgi:Family of unknown function (DUF5990)